jgi:fluoride ion exporter CrcB/FEX
VTLGMVGLGYSLGAVVRLRPLDSVNWTVQIGFYGSGWICNLIGSRYRGQWTNFSGGLFGGVPKKFIERQQWINFTSCGLLGGVPKVH